MIRDEDRPDGAAIAMGYLPHINNAQRGEEVVAPPR
jgi:hypothetical protein